MYTSCFMQLIGEVILIYAGVTTFTADKDDEEDPNQNSMVLWLQKHFSVINTYATQAWLFNSE